MGQWQWTKRGLWQLLRIRRGKREQKKRMRLFRARGLGELGQVASGSATQDLLLGNKTVGSQVVGKDWLGKLGKEEDEEKELATERRKEYTDLGSDLGERQACRLPCFSLGFGDDRRGMSGNRDLSLTIFFTSMSGSKSFTTPPYSSFHFRRPPVLRLAFDAAKREEKEHLTAISARQVKIAAAEEREREGYSSAEEQ